MDKVGPVLMGVAYLGVLVFIIVFCGTRTSTFDEFSKYWGLFGTIAGVTTGAIPSFFFKSQADKATDRADKADARANLESTKAQLYAGVGDPDKIEGLRSTHPAMFQ